MLTNAQLILKLAQMDTPQLREEYRKIRRETCRLLPRYSNQDFNRDVRSEMEYAQAFRTPRNWTRFAYKVYRQVVQEMVQHEEYLLAKRDEENL